MRTLFVTNYYPPSRYGWGYMQLCEEVADGLSGRGHDVAVLTSTQHDDDEITRPYPVHRLLCIDPDWHGGRPAAWQFFVGRRRRERQAVAHLRRLVAVFRPDVILFWHYMGLPRVLLQEAEQMPDVRTAYYLAGYHPELPDEHIAYWKARPVHWAAKLLKPLFARAALGMLARENRPVQPRYENVICVSDYVRQRLVSQGLISPDSIVIYNGVDLTRFSLDGHTQSARFSTGLSCLVAGRIAPEKGIHTVIDGFAGMRAQLESLPSITLTVLGDGPEDYRKNLEARVCANRLQDIIKFRSPIPRELMPEMLAKHNVLILASEYDEPIARSMQEAMAMGRLVIGTTTGGSRELLVHGKTGLVFEPANPSSLVEQLLRALHEPELAVRLAQAGHQEVTENFDIRRTIDQIECYVRSLVESNR